MNLTKPLQWAASITAIATLLTYTKIIPATLSNIILVLLFTILYLIFNYKRSGFSLHALIPIILSLGIVIINKDPSMVSLILLWIMYDIFKNATINTQVVAKSFFITGISGYIIILIAYFTVHLNQHADLVMWRINKLITRSSLGFQQPNTSMMYALAIILSMILAYKMNWTKTILTIAVITGLYHFNQSRTSFILIIMVLLLNQLKISWPWPRLIFTITAITSYILMVIPINDSVNQLLSGRLSLYQSYNSLLGIHLLANPIAESKMLDNSYVQMILSKGIIFTIVFMISIIFIMKTKSTKGKIITLAYVLSAFTETTFLHFDLLFPLLLACLAIEPNNIKEGNPQINDSNNTFNLNNRSRL